MNFFLVFFCWWLTSTIFNIIDDEKEGKSKFFKYFWKILPESEEKILQFHKHSWLSITWILKKSNFIQTLAEGILEIKLSYWSLPSKTYRNWYSITSTLVVLSKFCLLSLQLRCPSSDFELLRISCSCCHFFFSYT